MKEHKLIGPKPTKRTLKERAVRVATRVAAAARYSKILEPAYTDGVQTLANGAFQLEKMRAGAARVARPKLRGT